MLPAALPQHAFIYYYIRVVCHFTITTITNSTETFKCIRFDCLKYDGIFYVVVIFSMIFRFGEVSRRKNADFLQKHAQQILYGHETEESVFRPNELT